MEKVFIDDVSTFTVSVDSPSDGTVTLSSVTELVTLKDSDCTVYSSGTFRSTYNVISVLATLMYNATTPMVAPFVFDGNSENVFRILGATTSIDCIQSGDYAETEIDTGKDILTVRATYSASGSVQFSVTPPDEPNYVSYSLGDTNSIVATSSLLGSSAMSARGTATLTVSYRNESDRDVIDSTDYDIDLDIDGTGSVSMAAGTELPYILDGLTTATSVVVFQVPAGLTTVPTPVSVSLKISNTTYRNDCVDFN